LEEWLAGHHTSNNPVIGAAEYHVFAVTGFPTFGNGSKDHWDVQIGVPIGPVVLELGGYVSILSLNCDISAHVKFPLIPSVAVGALKGELLRGITIEPITSNFEGSITLNVKDKWLCIKFSIQVFGKTYVHDPWSREVKLIPIPM